MATKSKSNNNRNKLIGLGIGAATVAGLGATVALTKKPQIIKQVAKAANTVAKQTTKPVKVSGGITQVKQHTRKVKGKLVTVKVGTRRVRINNRRNTIKAVKAEVVSANDVGKVKGSKFNTLSNQDEYLNPLRASQARSNQHVLQGRELNVQLAKNEGVGFLGIKTPQRKQLEALAKEVQRKRNAEREYRRKLATNLQATIGGNKIAKQGKRGGFNLGSEARASVSIDTSTGRQLTKAITPQKYTYEFQSPYYFGLLAEFARKKGSKDKKKRKVAVKGAGVIAGGAGIGGLSTAGANYLTDRKQLKEALTTVPKQRERLISSLRNPVQKELDQVNKQFDPKNNISLKQKKQDKVAAEVKRLTTKQSYLKDSLSEIDRTIDTAAPSGKMIKQAYIKKLAKTSGKGALVGGAVAGLGYGAYKLVNRNKRNNK
jgi:predicted RNA-binding Zn ribbon-like protein